MIPADADAKAEIARIRSEQERRSREIPSGFYGWNRAVNHFFQFGVCRAAIAALDEARLYPLDGRAVADIGCGSGTWLLEFAQWGADPDRMGGIDLEESRIRQARKRLPAADLHAGDAQTLPWRDGRFDVVSQFTVFTSILSSAVKSRVAAEMLRVTRPGGVVLWYDFRFHNPCNPNVRGIEAGEIQGLFPGCRMSLTKLTLAPPVARRVAPVSVTAAMLMERLPFLRTHYLGLIQKSASSLGRDD